MVSPHFSVLFRQKWQVACGHLQLLTEELFREALFFVLARDRGTGGSRIGGRRRQRVCGGGGGGVPAGGGPLRHRRGGRGGGGAEAELMEEVEAHGGLRPPVVVGASYVEGGRSCVQFGSGLSVTACQQRPKISRSLLPMRRPCSRPRTSLPFRPRSCSPSPTPSSSRLPRGAVGGAATLWLRSAQYTHITTPVDGAPRTYRLSWLGALHWYCPGMFHTASDCEGAPGRSQAPQSIL